MDRTAEEIAAAGLEALTHYGVKGMKWGVRRAGPTVEVSEKGKRLKSRGGRGLPAHEDAVAAETARRIAKSSGTKALSNQDLQTLATRMNLEQQVSRLESNQPKGLGKKFVSKLLGKHAKEAAAKVAKDQAAKKVASVLEKSAAKM